MTEPIDPNVRYGGQPDLVIRGLLTKRADLLGEAETIRDRLAAIKNDVGAVDRTLAVLGYDGDLEAQMPRQKRHVLFGRGELTRTVFAILRDATEPMTTRAITQEMLTLQGMDGRDRALLSDAVKRTAKALKVACEKHGAVRRVKAVTGEWLWEAGATEGIQGQRGR